MIAEIRIEVKAEKNATERSFTKTYQIAIYESQFTEIEDEIDEFMEELKVKLDDY